MKRFYYDLETTGVLHWKNGVHQISGLIEINGDIKEEFDFKCCPNPKAIINQEALDIGGLTKEQILAYPEMGSVYSEVIQMLDKYVDRYNKREKFHLVGYNNRHFDDSFFRAWFIQNGDNYFGSWFWSDSIDIMVLASDFLEEKRDTMENFKLMTVAKTLGIEVDEEKLHDAVYDIYLTRSIYQKIKSYENKYLQ